MEHKASASQLHSEQGGGVTEMGKSSPGMTAFPSVVETAAVEKASVRVLHMGKKVEGS
jgi:hypothetical protein